MGVSLRMELEEEVAAVEQNGTEMVLLGPPDNSHLHRTKLFQNSPTTSAKHETDSFSFLSLNPAKSELMAIFDKIQREVEVGMNNEGDDDQEQEEEDEWEFQKRIEL